MRALLVLPLALLLGGCAGGDDAAEETTGSVTVTLPAFSTARVYWLRDGKVWPVAREVQASGEHAAAVLDELLAGPTEDEEELGFTTAVPEGADVSLSESDELSVDGLGEPFDAGVAQIVFTLTELPGLKSVEIDGQSYTRADFEEQTPSVLVESPLPFEEVSSPLRVTGTANTFEATFNYELTDTDGKIVDEHFVTATSGTGTRGTFEFTTKPFTVPFDGIGSLIVFERSAEDGSRIHVVEIPLRMTR
jgi:Immunoglobulin-like domain of bacterial spore germination/Sporulation and spore germination